MKFFRGKSDGRLYLADVEHLIKRHSKHWRALRVEILAIEPYWYRDERGVFPADRQYWQIRVSVREPEPVGRVEKIIQTWEDAD